MAVGEWTRWHLFYICPLYIYKRPSDFPLGVSLQNCHDNVSGWAMLFYLSEARAFDKQAHKIVFVQSPEGNLCGATRGSAPSPAFPPSSPLILPACLPACLPHHTMIVSLDNGGNPTTWRGFRKFGCAKQRAKIMQDSVDYKTCNTYHIQTWDLTHRTVPLSDIVTVSHYPNTVVGG